MQLQLHNKKALDFFIGEHGGQLISIIRKHLFTLPHLQQECLLDTITKIWNHMDSFDDQNEFGNWVGAVARYRCLEFLRTHQDEATIAWLIEKEIAEDFGIIFHRFWSVLSHIKPVKQLLLLWI